MSVDGTLLLCSSDGPDIRQQLRFYTPLRWTPPLILIVLNGLDRDIQSAMEMLPLRSGPGMCHIGLTAPLRLSYMRIPDALVYIIYILLVYLFIRGVA